MELSLDSKIELDNSLEKEQSRFINTMFGKVINTGLDIGLRSVLPDLIENEVINVKDAILENGFKDRIKYSDFFSNKFRKKCHRNIYWEI